MIGKVAITVAGALSMATVILVCAVSLSELTEHRRVRERLVCLTFGALLFFGVLLILGFCWSLWQ